VKKIELAYIELDSLKKLIVKSTKHSWALSTISKENYLSCIVKTCVYADSYGEAIVKVLCKLHSNILVHIEWDLDLSDWIFEDDFVRIVINGNYIGLFDSMDNSKRYRFGKAKHVIRNFKMRYKL